MHCTGRPPVTGKKNPSPRRVGLWRMFGRRPCTQRRLFISNYWPSRNSRTLVAHPRAMLWLPHHARLLVSFAADTVGHLFQFAVALHIPFPVRTISTLPCACQRATSGSLQRGFNFKRDGECVFQLASAGVGHGFLNLSHISVNKLIHAKC